MAKKINPYNPNWRDEKCEWAISESQGTSLMIVIALILIAAVTAFLSADNNVSSADSGWWSSFLQNFSTEMLGAVATFILIEIFLDSFLFRAHFGSANLKLADFSRADLSDAILLEARLVSFVKGLKLTAKFEETTILPDGTHYVPTLGLEQMRRFGCIVDADDTK